MSRFEELDHRIGRHDDQPNPDCRLCNPLAPAAVNPATARGLRSNWDYDTTVGRMPRNPSYGSLWLHNGETLVFVCVHREGDMTGLWANPRKTEALSSSYKNHSSLINALSLHDDQLELGSGLWHARAQVTAVTNVLPTAAALAAPLGQDLEEWAREQNTAKLIVSMEKKGLFPISEVIHETHNDRIADRVKVISTVKTVLVTDSYQMMLPS